MTGGSGEEGIVPGSWGRRSGKGWAGGGFGTQAARAPQKEQSSGPHVPQGLLSDLS